MSEEIKEILEALKPHDKEFTKEGLKEYPLVLSVKEQKILLDYITNLREENEKLKEVCDKYEEEHSTKFNEWVFDKRENEKLTQLWLDSQEKIRKAIEYLEEPNRDNFDYSKAKLVEILRGDDNNER